MTSLRLDKGKRADKKVVILGVGVTSTSLSRVLEIINFQLSISNYGRPFLVATVNPEFIVLAQSDPEFRSILNGADLAVPDGVGLRLAGVDRIIPGRTLVSALISKDYKIFYLGGRPGVARRMAEKYGGMADGGHTNIKLQITNSQINDRIVKKINSFRPDILLVAYGAPWQEKWLWANREKLNAKCLIGVGGTFDYLVGDTQLPARYIERYGLEWLWRLIHQPWRFRRQLRLLQFVWLVLTSNLRTRT